MKKIILTIITALVFMIGCTAITGCSSNDNSSTGNTQMVSWGYGDDEKAFSINIPEEFGDFSEDGENAYYYVYGDANAVLDMIMFSHDSESLLMNDKTLKEYMDGMETDENIVDGTVSGEVATIETKNGDEAQGYKTTSEMNINGTKYYVNSFAFNYGVGCYSISLSSVEKKNDVWENMLSSLAINYNDDFYNDGDDEDYDSDDDYDLDDEDEDYTDPTANWTMEQQNCYEEAKSYLDSGAFSRKGLIHQLSSEYGSNYPRKVAIFVVNKLEEFDEVNWNDEAVEAAENYIDSMSFSKQELIHQLSSEAGDQFTQKQAERAVEKVYK